jgi:hypothetical protein
VEWLRLKEPLLCRLGLHKWQNYGKEVEIFWEEPPVGVGLRGKEMHREKVYEKCACKRCGVRLRRKLVTNSDGTLSCVGWEPDTEETDKD